MEGITLGQVVFGVVALMMAACSVLAVTSGRILRAATALLFVLFGTAGLYFMLGYTVFLLASYGFARFSVPPLVELDPVKVGDALIGMGKYQFVLPFEVISVLLLACMIGAIMIARKR